MSDLKHINRLGTHQNFENFLIIDHLSDNEKETRIKWKELMGKETSLDAEESERYANR